MAEHLKVHEHIAKIQEVEERHQQELEGIRTTILGDTALPDLDRIVLGLTGSGELLAKYRSFEARVRENRGETALVIYKHEGAHQDGKTTAMAGVITGELQIIPNDVRAVRGVVDISMGVNLWSDRTDRRIPFNDEQPGIVVATLWPATHSTKPHSLQDHLENTLFGREEIYRLPEFSSPVVRGAMTSLDARTQQALAQLDT